MFMRTPALLAMSLGLIVGCSSERSPRQDRDVALHPTLSNATQADLAREIEQADRRGTWRETKLRWQGQRLHWTVTRQRVLCQSADACHVAAFPIQRPAQVGWLPALELTPGEYSKIAQTCGTAEQCDLEIEGTLSDLALSADMPTSVRFADVRVIGAHKHET